MLDSIDGTNLTKRLMKRKPISILQLAVITLVASTLCFIANVRAQNENQRSDTSIADNPHLRRSSGTSSSPSGTISEKDKKFLGSVVSGGLQEVADGQLAEKEGSAEVKKVAARMVADHSKATKEVVELAKKKGLRIDTKPAEARDIGKANFDSQYLYTMGKDHERDIKAFETEASSGDDADLKAWAAKTLPTLRAHLAMVKDARKKVK